MSKFKFWTNAETEDDAVTVCSEEAAKQNMFPITFFLTNSWNSKPFMVKKIGDLSYFSIFMKLESGEITEEEIVAKTELKTRFFQLGVEL